MINNAMIFLVQKCDPFHLGMTDKYATHSISFNKFISLLVKMV